MKSQSFQPLLRHHGGLADGIDIASVRIAEGAGSRRGSATRLASPGRGKRDEETRTGHPGRCHDQYRSPGECEAGA